MTVRGIPQLQARVKRLGDTKLLLSTFTLTGMAQIRLETPRKTSNLSRNNQLGSITPLSVDFTNTANYAIPVHQGSRPHDIVPRRAKVLRWPVKGSARLSGAAKSGGAVIFARRVHHPGNKPNPWIIRGLQKAIGVFGLRNAVYRLWNGR